jgi:hypothetical protein
VVQPLGSYHEAITVTCSSPFHILPKGLVEVDACPKTTHYHNVQKGSQSSQEVLFKSISLPVTFTTECVIVPITSDKGCLLNTVLPIGHQTWNEFSAHPSNIHDFDAPNDSVDPGRLNQLLIWGCLINGNGFPYSVHLSGSLFGLCAAHVNDGMSSAVGHSELGLVTPLPP